jgi:hypothetical protein
MPFTAPPTEVAGNALTAALWNTYIRDNLNFLRAAHACRVWNSVNQGTTSGAVTPITFDTEAFDSDAFHDSGTNPSRMTVPTGLDGYYLITGVVVFSNNATGIRDAKLVLNGVAGVGTDLAAGRQDNPSGTNNARVLVTTTYRLAAADYVELVALQSSGGALGTVGGDINQNQLSLIWIGL